MNDFQNISAELKASCRWVIWRLEDQDQRTDLKVPYQAKSPKYGASHSDPNHWATFAEATAALDKAVAWKKGAKNGVCGIGLVVGKPFLGIDLDKCRNPETEEVEQWALDLLKELNTYTEISQSGKGYHCWIKGESEKDGIRKGQVEVYAKNRYLTMTGLVVKDYPTKLREFSKSETAQLFSKVKDMFEKEKKPKQDSSFDNGRMQKLMAGDFQGAGFNDISQAVMSLLTHLAVKHLLNKEKIEADFKASGLYKDFRPLGRQSNWIEKWERMREEHLEKAIEYGRENLAKQLKPKTQELDPDSWREGCKSKGQLTTELPRFLLGGLIPEKALTFITAPSYNCKTWFALQCAHAISVGCSLWGFDGPSEPVPVLYNVPEMNEALVRQYMEVLGIEDSDMFLVRTMEAGIWPLDSPIMERASEGRVVFNDTMGYFNPADDTNEYRQSLLFGTLVYKLLNKGARAVVGLSHITKTAAKNESAWTLEDSVHGSVGYGGILRSCLRMVNLNPDLNDPMAWLYVQGMKNPGLKPFQLEGPMPLKMKVPPGESPYLADLLKKGTGDTRTRANALYVELKKANPRMSHTRLCEKVKDELGISRSHAFDLCQGQQKQSELKIEEEKHDF